MDVSPESPLLTPVQFVKGVGPQRAELLAKLGLETAEDLLWFLPRDVFDLTDVQSVDRIEPDILQTVRGQVVDVDGRRISRGRTITSVLLDCDGKYVKGVWFNQSWVLKRFFNGQTVLFSGKPKRRGGRWEISHPQIQFLEDADAQETGGVLPRYGLTEGIRMFEMRRIVRNTVEEYARYVVDPLPDKFRTSLELPPLAEAVRGVHRPGSMEEYKRSRERILFDDLFEFQLGLALRRRIWKSDHRSVVMETTTKIDARIRRLFPFEFTAGQDQAIEEIVADLKSGEAMHRLLQADVGAGKTVVALYAMLVAVAAGYQTILMAPTEVLALQHWETVQQTLTHSRVERFLLTGQLTAKQRQKALEQIRTGEKQLIVGTQALIQKDVTFANLGLAVIDEQHKFGVAQRARFSSHTVSDDANDENQDDASGPTPHILVMTATPIPRSVCMTQFGDLDISTISELPPGRQTVITSRVSTSAACNKAWEFIRKQLSAGRQGYVICPRIDDEDGTDSPAGVEQMATELARGELRNYRVGLIHGRMESEEKSRIMRTFEEQQLDVLVSTTVVEVGVDIPNATLMLIQQAERFGLSQLHQLRGRIGRGTHQSYCFLFSMTESDEASQRLATLEQFSDGFRIAEADFELRGPGDVLGTRQHGKLPLKVANLVRDQTILHDARLAAFDLISTRMFDHPEFDLLRNRVIRRFGEWMRISRTG